MIAVSGLAFCSVQGGVVGIRSTLDGDEYFELCWNQRSQHNCILEDVQKSRMYMYSL